MNSCCNKKGSAGHCLLSIKINPCNTKLLEVLIALSAYVIPTSYMTDKSVIRTVKCKFFEGEIFGFDLQQKFYPQSF